MAIQNAIGGIIRKMLMALGDDATGDTYYTDANGEIENRAIGDLGDVFQVQQVGPDLLPGWAPFTAPYQRMPSNLVTGVTSGMEPNVRIVIGRAAVSGLCTLTLPTIANTLIGDMIPICGRAQDGFRVAQLATQRIIFNGSTSTEGVGGYVQSTSPNDALVLVAVDSNIWQVVSSNGSAFTVE